MLYPVKSYSVLKRVCCVLRNHSGPPKTNGEYINIRKRGANNSLEKLQNFSENASIVGYIRTAVVKHNEIEIPFG